MVTWNFSKTHLRDEILFWQNIIWSGNILGRVHQECFYPYWLLLLRFFFWHTLISTGAVNGNTETLSKNTKKGILVMLFYIQGCFSSVCFFPCSGSHRLVYCGARAGISHSWHGFFTSSSVTRMGRNNRITWRLYYDIWGWWDERTIVRWLSCCASDASGTAW